MGQQQNQPRLEIVLKLKVEVTSQLPASAAKVWGRLKSSDTLQFVAAPKVYFDGHNFDPQWQVDKPYHMKVRQGNSQKRKDYEVTFTEINDQTMEMSTTEHGDGVRSWEHSMKVEPLDWASCWYTDVVEFDMGLITPLAWFWVHSYYQHRHRRWLELLNQQ